MTTLPFTIRPILPDDLASVLALYITCEDFLALGPQPKASMEMVLADLEISRKVKGIYCGIFLQDGILAGILDYVPSHYEDNPAHSFISLLMIDPRYRHQGLGLGVMEWVEARVSEDAAITHILLGVQVNNPAAIQFWNNYGFHQIGPPEHFPDGTTGFPMEKVLRPSQPASPYQGKPGLVIDDKG